MKTCENCNRQFAIRIEDQKFYREINVPEPVLCPVCRYQRRLAFRNERNLYQRKCDLCNKNIISIYHEKAPFPVYCQKCWWSDKWDPIKFDRDFDFNKTFFKQYQELLNAVPKVCLYNIQAENSEYCNFCMGNKDCYLVFGSDKNHSCLYSTWIYECKNSVDCSYCYNCELLYMCLDCVNCYECFYCQDCEQSQNCYYSIDLKSCRNCFGCIGLRHKEYHLFNKPVIKEEFEIFIRNLDQPEQYAEKIKELSCSIPRKASHVVNSENFVGDFIVNSKDIFQSFDVRNGQNISYSDHIFDRAKDCMDCSYSGEIELCYEGYEEHGYNLHFSHRCWPSSNSQYLDNCDNCDSCFGCVGLRHKSYCILNKQYPKEEYESLVSKIISYLKQTKEYGEFFPIKLSPFAYNETVAQEVFPLEKDEILSKQFKWKEIEDKTSNITKTIEAEKLPLNISKIPDDITNWALLCIASQRPYKIIPQELLFYRKYNLPIPKLHPDERHKQRMARRNSRLLFTKKCDKCGQEVQTTYTPETTQKIYCEKCYLQEVY